MQSLNDVLKAIMKGKSLIEKENYLFNIRFAPVFFMWQFKKNSDSDSTESSEVKFEGNLAICGEYAFRSSAMNNDLLYFWDLESGSYEVFCAQPDCKHQTYSENPDTKCTAASPDGTIYDYAFTYNNKLYSICSSNLNEFIIYEADTDGLNRKKVFTSESSFSTMIYPYFIDGNLVFVGTKYNVDDLGNQNFTGEYYLCSLNFDDWSYTELADLGEENKVIFSMNSLYIYENNVYIGLIENNDDEYISKYMSYDLSGNSSKKLIKTDDDLGIDSYFDSEMLYSLLDDNDNSKVYSFDLNSQESELLFEIDRYVYEVYKKDDDVFCLYDYGASDSTEISGALVYSLKNNEITLEKEFDDDFYLGIEAHISDVHIILYQNSEQDSFGILSDEDFWSLNFENAQFCFEQLEY